VHSRKASNVRTNFGSRSGCHHSTSSGDPGWPANWFTVTGFRQLAINASTSVSKGDRIIVTGKLRVRDWDNGERTGTSVEIEADSIGHDLSWGSAKFTRTVLVREQDPSADEAESVSVDVDNLSEVFLQEAELVGNKK
jgi:single-stranded DNA-binding protein